jgi:hypothetical protein
LRGPVPPARRRELARVWHLSIGTGEMGRKRASSGPAGIDAGKWWWSSLHPRSLVIQDGQSGAQLLLRHRLCASTASRRRRRRLRSRADREHRRTRGFRIGARVGDRSAVGASSSADVCGGVNVSPPARLAPTGGRIAGTVGREGGRSGRVRATRARRAYGLLEEGRTSQTRCSSRVDSPRGGWGDRAERCPRRSEPGAGRSGRPAPASVRHGAARLPSSTSRKKAGRSRKAAS